MASRNGLRRVRFAAVLAALSAFCAGCLPHLGTPPPSTSGKTGASGAWKVTFRDVAAERGVDFDAAQHRPSPLTILDTAPGGCAFLDFDQDGRLDILLVAPDHVAAYRNVGDGRFVDVTAQMGLPQRGRWVGCTVGDFDNDGYPDLVLTGYRCGALLRNDHGRRFVDATARSNVRFDQWTTSAAFSDIDGDGLLDLYVAAYVDYRIGTQDHCKLGAITTACGPEPYPAERGRLYRNLGNGQFRDVTHAAGLDSASGKTWGVAFADFDADGRPDLYLANDQTPGNLFHNLGGGKFKDIGTLSGAAYDAAGSVQGGMGVDWGDSDGDGRLDLFVTTYSGQTKQLYHSEGNALFRTVSNEVGLNAAALPYVAFGCGFLDANNDGALDLFIANGHVRDNIALHDASQSYLQPMQLFANQGAGAFVNVSAQAGSAFQQPAVGRGAAFGDFDNDGWEDILVVDLEGRARLLRNEGAGSPGNWLSIRLDGGKANREGLGARITVEAGGRRQVREITRGRSVLSASDSSAHVGLGSAASVERVTVHWPGGGSEEWRNLPCNKPVTLHKGGGKPVAG